MVFGDQEGNKASDEEAKNSDNDNCAGGSTFWRDDCHGGGGGRNRREIRIFGKGAKWLSKGGFTTIFVKTGAAIRGGYDFVCGIFVGD